MANFSFSFCIIQTYNWQIFCGYFPKGRNIIWNILAQCRGLLIFKNKYALSQQPKFIFTFLVQITTNITKFTISQVAMPILFLRSFDRWILYLNRNFRCSLVFFLWIRNSSSTTLYNIVPL